MIYISSEAHAFLKANGGASYASALIERESCFSEFEFTESRLAVEHRGTGLKFTLNEDGKVLVRGELDYEGSFDLGDLIHRAAFLLKSARENPSPVGPLL